MALIMIIPILLKYIIKVILFILKKLTKLLKWLMKNELKYQAGKRPVALAIVTLLIVAAIAYAAYSNGIRSITDLARTVSRFVVRIYRYVLEIVVQYVADVLAGMLEYIIEFIFGVLVGIVSLWKNFKLPKISVPELKV